MNKTKVENIYDSLFEIVYIIPYFYKNGEKIYIFPEDNNTFSCIIKKNFVEDTLNFLHNKNLNITIYDIMNSTCVYDKTNVVIFCNIPNNISVPNTIKEKTNNDIKNLIKTKKINIYEYLKYAMIGYSSLTSI